LPNPVGATLGRAGGQLRIPVNQLTNLAYPADMKRYFAPLVSLLLAFGLTACSKVPRLEPLGPNDVVLAFGDSLTFGTGAAPSESYPAQLAALINRRVINAGVPGEVSADGLARLPELLAEHKPKLLILCHGGNDFLRKLPDPATAANLRAMVRLATSERVAVVLIATPKPGLSMAPAGFYSDLAKEFSLPFNDAVLKEVLRDNALKSDLVHPNAKGYGLIAEAVSALLKKAKAVD
jgi:lysophospholipase L1-like esterase